MADTASLPVAPPIAAASKGFRLGLRSKFTGALALFILAILAAAGTRVRLLQQYALDKEIRERGLALARALAANSVEPLSLGEGKTLDIMLLVKDVIQTSTDAEGTARKLTFNDTALAMIWEDLKRFGHEAEVSGLRNEGVLFAYVVDPTGKIVAAADAQLSQDKWLDATDKPYQPVPASGLLSPSDDEKIWDTPHLNGTYVIAVPIRQRQAGSGGADTPAPAGAGAPPPAGAAAPPAGAPAAPGAFMGTVYLGMSQSIIRRALAVAVSKLLFVAAGVLIGGGIIAVFIANLLVKPIHLLRDGALEIGKGNLNQQVRITRRDELGELASAFNDMTKGLSERELIGSAFGRYVSKDVLADILKNPDAMKLGGARRLVTMVDSDVRGFTSMSERLDPEAVVSVINAYLDIQAKIVREFGGTVDRFVGDEVQAVFGVPAERPDDAERAVRCAWAIKLAVAKLIDERTRAGQPAPRIGIGVDSGHVVAGNMGAQGAKLDYSIVGDPVGTAKELVDAARDPDVPGGQVVLSEDTYALVKDLVEVRELAPLELHGRSAPLRCFDLVGLKPAVAGTGGNG